MTESNTVHFDHTFQLRSMNYKLVSPLIRIANQKTPFFKPRHTLKNSPKQAFKIFQTAPKFILYPALERQRRSGFAP